MPTTPRSKLPYPASTDPADVPGDLSKLALALDEIAYAEITASLTLPNGVVTDVVSSGAVTYDGSPVLIEFFSPIFVLPVVAGGYIGVNLYDAATDLGLFTQIAMPLVTGTASATLPVYLQTRLTPTAASHTYRIRAQAHLADGTVGAGGGAMSAYIRVRRA